MEWQRGCLEWQRGVPDVDWRDQSEEYDNRKKDNHPPKRKVSESMEGGEGDGSDRMSDNVYER